jgi:hypothetical protein
MQNNEDVYCTDPKANSRISRMNKSEKLYCSVAMPCLSHIAQYKFISITSKLAYLQYKNCRLHVAVDFNRSDVIVNYSDYSHVRYVHNYSDIFAVQKWVCNTTPSPHF